MPSSATQREIAILYRTDRSAAKLCAQQQAALSAWARMVVAAFAEAEARNDPNWQRYLPWRWRF